MNIFICLSSPINSHLSFFNHCVQCIEPSEIHIGKWMLRQFKKKPLKKKKHGPKKKKKKKKQKRPGWFKTADVQNFKVTSDE